MLVMPYAMPTGLPGCGAAIGGFGGSNGSRDLAVEDRSGATHRCTQSTR